jgi:hypothetical protein
MEERMKKVFTLALLLTVVAAMGAWAQNFASVPGTTTRIWESPQNSATEGRYRSNADNFIRPDSYTGVKFDKWFGFTSFLNNYGEGSTDSIATIGLATKISKVYIGAFYGGNFWTGKSSTRYTEQEATPTGGTTGKYKVYQNISVSPRPTNNAALLIGVADMGIRLTYRTNYQWFNKNDIVYGGQLYKNYHAGEGYIAPQIAWAMAKNLTENGIRPYVTVDMIFDRNYLNRETAGGTSGVNIVRSMNHIDSSLGLGLGGYTFLSKGGFRASFDLDYIFALNLYNNEYSYIEGGQYKTAKIKGVYRDTGNINYLEQSFMSNSLTPSLSGQWSKDRLALRFKLNLAFGLTNEKQGAMDLVANNLRYNGAKDSINVFTFRPDLRLAMQFQAIPSRLTLNTGARIQATAITLRTTDHKYYTNDVEVTGQASKIHETTYWDNTGTGSSFASRFHIGATINFTDNASVEAMTGISNRWGDSAVDLFAPGGLFSFGSIMVGLKF